MVMHEAYSAARKAWPNWRGWLTAFFVALFLVPLVGGAASPAQALVGVMLICLIPVGMLMGLCLGARQLLKAVFKLQEPFNFFAVAATLAAVALACFDLFAVPAYKQLFASFGANLPAPTLFLLEYHYLLLLPAVLQPFMVFRLRNHPRREDYFAAVLAGEFFVLLMCVLLYVQIFKVGEAVAG